jgi:hypothetical protein
MTIAACEAPSLLAVSTSGDHGKLGWLNAPSRTAYGPWV